MAAVAIGIGGGEIVIVVEMAECAGGRDVCASQRKARAAVIECGGGPGNRVVANGAIGSGERGASSGVSWIVGLLPG